jgi:hypothetical protein
MNTDEHGLKRIVLSAFIGVDRRLKVLFPEFFSTLFQAAVRIPARARRRLKAGGSQDWLPHR